jgi:transposase
MLDRLDPSIEELNQAVLQEAESRRAALCLMEHPGVGPVTSLAFVLTLGPVVRFQKSKQLVSYLGLNPRESSSGGKQRLGSISKQGNSMMRFLLVEAAQAASRFDPRLRRDYQRLKFRRGSAVAKVPSQESWRCGCIGSCGRQFSQMPPARMQGSPKVSLVDRSPSIP